MDAMMQDSSWLPDTSKANDFIITIGFIALLIIIASHLISGWYKGFRLKQFYKQKMRQPVDEAQLATFEGRLLQSEITKTIKNLDQLSPEQHSTIIAIDGGWGTGKTLASFKLYEKLEAHDKGKLTHHMYYFALLPFGNITESLNRILGILAQGLKSKSGCKVDKELQEVLTQATPVNDTRVNFSFLGFSLSKTLNSRLQIKGPHHNQQLHKKLRDLSKEERLVVVIDDLDRMQPKEVVIVIRMVEAFRQIPGIVFILPFYRKVVTQSIGHHLRMDSTNAHAYLRKFIDTSIHIELEPSNLQVSFERGFNGHKISGRKRLYKYKLSKVAWSILIHILLLQELKSELEKITANPVGKHMNRMNFLARHSSYIEHLHKLCSSNAVDRLQDLSILSDSPVDNTEGWWPLHQRFEAVGRFADRDNRSKPMDTVKDPNQHNYGFYISQINQLIEATTMVKDTCDTVATSNCNCDGEHNGDIFLSKVIIPGIKEKTTAEPMLTKNYSRRDMEQLGAAIARTYKAGENKKGVERDVAQELATIIEDEYKKFR